MALDVPVRERTTSDQSDTTAESRSTAPEVSLLQRLACMGYSVGVYAFFFATFLALIAFVPGVFLDKTLDSGSAGQRWRSIAIDSALVLVFAVQHTIMARPRFKDAFARHLPRAIERSTFVLVASALLAALMFFWQPLPAAVWSVENPTLRAALYGVSALGWATVLLATFLIDHFDLFGLRQPWLHLRNKARSEHPFTRRGFYRVVRHPLMLGFLLAFWSAPTMSQGHLLFASAFTLHILCGIRFEERDLVRTLGTSYESYRRETPGLLPWPRFRKNAQAVTSND